MKELLAYRLMFPVTSRLHARSVSLHRSQTGPWGPIRVPWGPASRGGDQCPQRGVSLRFWAWPRPARWRSASLPARAERRAPSESGDLTTVGFVAVGPEGAWRQANEKNMQETFTEEAGFDLKYAPATNLDQKSQIDAFTSFVDEGVDVILLSATEGIRLGGLAQACAGGRDPRDPASTAASSPTTRTSTSPASRPTTSRSQVGRRLGGVETSPRAATTSSSRDPRASAS